MTVFYSQSAFDALSRSLLQVLGLLRLFVDFALLVDIHERGQPFLALFT